MKNKTEKTVMRGELALLMVVVLNSLGVLLMLHSGSGISAISSVPYAFQKVMPRLTLGTWTYIFQGLLVCTLMLMQEKIRSHLPVQFCGRLCVWRTDGSSRALDYTSSGKSAAACAVFCAELSDPLFRYCAFKPLQAPDCPDGSVPA